MPTLGGRNASIRMCWLDNKRSMESVAPLSGRWAQMFEDFDDSQWVLNGNQNLEIALAVVAGLNVNVAYRGVGERPGKVLR